MVTWFAFLAIVMARWLFGDGDMVVLNSDGLVILSHADIVWRYAGAFVVAFLALLTVSTLSICLSVFTDNSIGPIVATMAVVILFTIIGTLDVRVFDFVRPFLFTTHMAAWRSFFDQPVPIADIRESVSILMAQNIIVISVALAAFSRKDITT
jgi:ABC-2 type transport system permease protein